MINRILIFTVAFFVFGFAQAQTKKWTLREAVQYALDNNITVKQTELDMENTKISKKDAFGNFLPSINANTSHQWSIGLNQNITTGLLENQTTQFTSVGVNANMLIFDGLRNFNTLHRANLAILANQLQLDKIKDDISLLVVNSFLQIVFNRESLNTLLYQNQVTEEQVQRTTQLVEAGASPRGDLLDIQATNATEKQRIIAAENTLKLSKISLAQLLLIKDYENFEIQDEEFLIPPPDMLAQNPGEIFESAKELRSEIKLAEANVDVAEKDLAISRGASYPTISLFYNYNTRASSADIFGGVLPDTENPFSQIGFVEGTNERVLTPNFNRFTVGPENLIDQFTRNDGHTVGFQLSVPVFNGFQTANSIKRSKINLERAKNQLEQDKLDLESNVYQAYFDAESAYKSYEAAQRAFEARTLAFDYSQERFNVGLMNAFDYLQAKSALETAESEVIRSKFDYVFKLKVLEFFFGIPFDKL
ncbi:MAG: TolC family protein [Flavobacteriaceae bacterium]|nr:TolC family protein [Flavobacteriaceae bacterium]